MEATIRTLIEKRNRTLTTYTEDALTPEDIKSKSALNTHFYMVLITEKYPKGVYVDLSTLMLEQIVGQMDTWEGFFTHLTPAMVDSYILSGSGLGVEGIGKFQQSITIQPMAMLNLDIAYCDSRDPTTRNKRYKRWDLPDLVISKQQSDIDNEDIHLENCIISVNGLICYSNVLGGELFVQRGAQNLWSINRDTSPNITMIDTTPLGELKRLKLSQCTLQYENHDAEHTYDKDIKIILPEEYDLSQYTPILVLAGKAFFPDVLNIINERMIAISPYRLNLETLLLGIAASQADYVPHTTVLHPETSPLDFLYRLGRGGESDIYNTLYLIKNNDIKVQREYCIPDLYWLTSQNKNRPGILVRKSDGAWMDYTLFDYNRYDLYCGVRYPQQYLRATPEVEKERQVGITNMRCHHLFDRYRWMRDSSYEMVYLTC